MEIADYKISRNECNAISSYPRERERKNKKRDGESMKKQLKWTKKIYIKNQRRMEEKKGEKGRARTVVMRRKRVLGVIWRWRERFEGGTERERFLRNKKGKGW